MTTLALLGTAQDGGLPHAGCRCANCERARRDHGFRRTPAALGIVADDGTPILVDATSAFAEQWHALWQLTPAARDAGERYGAPPIVLLTHAHSGHYLGLWQLDRSVLAARGTRVLAPPRMARFLAAQEPWAGMQREGFIALEPLPFDEPLDLAPGVRITALEVPHRAEWGTDTAGLLIAGPTRRAFYLPDIDSWQDWQHDIRDVVAGVDVAILDGCFWEPFPIPGVPHPPVRDSLELLQPLAGAAREIVFTHLNHSNPLADPASAEAREVTRRGFAVAREGQTFTL